MTTIPVMNCIQTEFEELLCSKDLSRLSELAWIDQKVLGRGKANNQRFLDGKINMTGNKVDLCSYP